MVKAAARRAALEVLSVAAEVLHRGVEWLDRRSYDLERPDHLRDGAHR